MRTTILFLMILSLFTACETGETYEKNTTHKKVVLTDRSSGVSQNIDDLVLNDKEFEDDDSLIGDPVPDEAYVDDDEEYLENSGDTDTFESQEVTSTGLDVHKIRVGKHNNYIRLVLDVYEGSHKATSVGSYNAKYYANRDEIVVTLNGYSKFSASLPSFSSNSIIKQIVFSDHKKNENSYRFTIKLRQEAKVRIFDLKNPARLAFDINPLN